MWMLGKQIVRVGTDGPSLKSWQTLILLVLDIPPKI